MTEKRFINRMRCYHTFEEHDCIWQKGLYYLITYKGNLNGTHLLYSQWCSSRSDHSSPRRCKVSELDFLNGSWIISRLPKQSRSILRHCDCFLQPFIASLWVSILSFFWVIRDRFNLTALMFQIVPIVDISSVYSLYREGTTSCNIEKLKIEISWSNQWQI